MVNTKSVELFLSLSLNLTSTEHCVKFTLDDLLLSHLCGWSDTKDIDTTQWLCDLGNTTFFRKELPKN